MIIHPFNLNQFLVLDLLSEICHTFICNTSIIFLELRFAQELVQFSNSLARQKQG